jgi:D-alanyl-D-alanine-carboxypeptidase/D-alanyl-D-alanine-endopeptidase
MVKAFGSSGTDRPLDPDTIMEIGSITMPFTGTLLAEMASRSEVALDDPIGRYLPIPTPRRGDREITLLDLATQTSRLPRSGWILIRQAFGNRREPFARYTTSDLYRQLSRARIRRGIGDRLRYSNVGFALLGHVLGLEAGSSYEELIVERVCRPLGLIDTGSDGILDAAERRARGHGRGGVAVPHLRAPAFAGAGILRSTARDMLRFLRVTSTRRGRRSPAPCGPRRGRTGHSRAAGWPSVSAGCTCSGAVAGSCGTTEGRSDSDPSRGSTPMPTRRW